MWSSANVFSKDTSLFAGVSLVYIKSRTKSLKNESSWLRARSTRITSQYFQNLPRTLAYISSLSYVRDYDIEPAAFQKRDGPVRVEIEAKTCRCQGAAAWIGCAFAFYSLRLQFPTLSVSGAMNCIPRDFSGSFINDVLKSSWFFSRQSTDRSARFKTIRGWSPRDFNLYGVRRRLSEVFLDEKRENRSEWFWEVSHHQQRGKLCAHDQKCYQRRFWLIYLHSHQWCLRGSELS